jgi:hypothetical protein
MAGKVTVKKTTINYHGTPPPRPKPVQPTAPPQRPTAKGPAPTSKGSG